MAVVVRGRLTKVALDAELERAAAFRTALRRLLARTDAVANLAGLTSQRYDLLLQIRSAGNEGVRVTELCQRLQLRQTAVTELVKRAEDVGLVERRRSAKDGRVSLLGLTAEGERRLLHAFDALRKDRAVLVEAFREIDASFRAATR